VDPGLGALVANVAMTAGLARALEEHPPSSLVYLSTLDVYGCHPPLPITEQTPVAPESPYAIAKYASERVLLASLERRCPVTVLRLPGVYGGADPPKSIPRRLVDTILGGGTVRLHGGGTTRRDYLHVDDLCHVVAAILERPCAGVLNVATGEALTIRGIVETLARGAGAEARIEPVPETGDGAADLVLDTTGLRQSLPGLGVRPMSVALVEYAATRGRVR
jgi:nucleoside-diphosphate-sugar epimerase